MAKVNRQWRLRSRPQGEFRKSDFEWREDPVPDLKAGQVLVRNVLLSLDPTNRIWANEADSYLPAVELGAVMRGLAVGVVEASENPGFRAGDRVQGLLGWQDYLISEGQGLSKLPVLAPGQSWTAYLGLYGHIGLTAYFGMLEIGQPKAGETVVVSGAAGAVGSLAGQIAKIQGCRVVGIAGSREKCRWLRQDLGFDGAIDYKLQDVADELRRQCPDGIDVCFENVGGAILDAVLGRINLGARIALCGLIAQYNSEQPVAGPYNFHRLLMQRARVEGFLVLDYAERAAEAFPALAEWHAQGRLKYRVDQVAGLENAPEAVNKLFDGNHQGKLVVLVSAEPE